MLELHLDLFDHTVLLQDLNKTQRSQRKLKSTRLDSWLMSTVLCSRLRLSRPWSVFGSNWMLFTHISLAVRRLVLTDRKWRDILTDLAACQNHLTRARPFLSTNQLRRIFSNCESRDSGFNFNGWFFLQHWMVHRNSGHVVTQKPFTKAKGKPRNPGYVGWHSGAKTPALPQNLSW